MEPRQPLRLPDPRICGATSAMATDGDDRHGTSFRDCSAVVIVVRRQIAPKLTEGHTL